MQVKEHTRLLLPTLLVSVLLLCLGGLGAWYLHRSQQDSSRLLRASITRVQAAEELMLVGTLKQVALDQFLMTGKHEYLAPILQLRQDASDWIRRADLLATDEADETLIKAMQAGHEHLAAALDELIETPPSVEERPVAIARVNGILNDEILEPAREYKQFNRNRLAELTSRNQAFSDHMGTALMMLGACGALAGLLAGYAVARALQRRLMEHQQAIARSQQLATLGRVAAALAHELRNPLTSMRIIAQSATTTDDHVTLDVEDYSILEQEIERLDDSIQTFLDYARPPRPELRPCLVQTLVRQSVALVERRAAQTGLELRVDLPSEPVEIEADPSQVKQVLLNILLNALEASPHGGVVTLRSRMASSEDVNSSDGDSPSARNMVDIEIADTGTGLPDNLGDRIFDAFVSTKETGTGLGLAICKRIMEEHGGEIEAHNVPNGGAAITIRFRHVQPVTHETHSEE